jgi:ATP-dependent helicase/nuclease subunit B
MRIHSIPAGARFAELLAQGLLRATTGAPEDLADARVLLPTRRAARTLRAALASAAGGATLLLPRLEPIGDVDDDDLLREAEAEAHGLLPAIAPTRRLAILTQFLRERGEDGDAVAADPTLACRLAAALVQLLDAAALEEVDLARLDAVVDADIAAHWQRARAVLAVLREDWPRLLAAAGRMDPAERRIAALRRRIAAWQAHPPQGLVIAAGSTGSIPATADLLGVVARLPRGALVLPGLDHDLDAASWAAAEQDPAHPQHGLARLLARLGVDRDAVTPWPGAPAPHPRVALLRDALRPAATTPDWPTLPRPGPEAFAGLARLEAATQQEEALAIALALRAAIAEPGCRAALITADRVLARRVAAELRRWGLAVDDSGGTPLSHTPQGVFLRATAAWAADPSDPVALLAALKHPLAQAGLGRDGLLAGLRRLERRALRGLRPAPGVAGLVAAVAATEDPESIALVRHLAGPLGAFAEALAAPALPPATMLARHVDFLAWLAAPDAAALWRGEAGEALRAALDDLAAALDALAPMRGHGWPALLAALLDDRVVRPPLPTHPRLSIWGPLEARLQHADLLVLGGLNEGRWPPEPRDDPWLSRPMRAALGLPPVERRIGLSAHDFVQGAAAPRVLLTWSRKVDGVPTAPARWLQRLEAFLGAHASWMATRDTVLPALASGLDLADGAARALAPPRRPAPRPHAALRPTTLPVTDIETLVRDPYAIFARRILALKPLDPVDMPPGAAMRGVRVHAALRALIAPGRELPAEAEAALLAHGRAAFADLLDRPVVGAVWWPRFARLAAWFVAWERRRRAAGAMPRGVEAKGRLALASGFVLTARADRIDALPEGGLAIIDYKTGMVPTSEMIRAGFAPQLPLEAAIAAAGGFEGLAPARPTELVHLRLTGGSPPGEEKPVRVKDMDAAGLAAAALTGLERLVAAYADPGMPYLARPRVRFLREPGAYDHLARVAEWVAAGDES